MSTTDPVLSLQTGDRISVYCQTYFLLSRCSPRLQRFPISIYMAMHGNLPLRFHFLGKLFFLFIPTILFVTISLLSGCRNNEEAYSSIAAYKDDLKGKIGIAYEKSIDINNDGRLEQIMVLYGGEEVFIDILIPARNRLACLSLPQAEEYEIFVSPEKRYVLRIGHSTFQQFGDVHSSDCYPWSDFFEIRGRRLEDVSRKYADYYERMINIYRTRKEEIEEIVKTMDQDDVFRQLDIDQAKRYGEFMTRAQELIKERCTGYADMTKGPENLSSLINEHFPGHVLSEVGDLSAKARSYYEHHVMNFDPFLIARDFDGNGLNDLAMLLKQKDGAAKEKVFVVLMQFGLAHYEMAFRSTLENDNDDLFLIPVPSWQALGWEALFRNPAVVACTFEDASGIAVVWNEQFIRFDEKMVSDILCH